MNNIFKIARQFADQEREVERLREIAEAHQKHLEEALQVLNEVKSALVNFGRETSVVTFEAVTPKATMPVPVEKQKKNRDYATHVLQEKDRRILNHMKARPNHWFGISDITELFKEELKDIEFTTLRANVNARMHKLKTWGLLQVSPYQAGSYRFVKETAEGIKSSVDVADKHTARMDQQLIDYMKQHGVCHLKSLTNLLYPNTPDSKFYAMYGRTSARISVLCRKKWVVRGPIPGTYQLSPQKEGRV